MPFTLAHPGAVVFVKSKYLSGKGLILGSMAPDFMYFILFSPSSNFGHTLTGAVLLNIPLCFLLNELYHKFLRKALIWSLPLNLSKNYSYLTQIPNSVNSLRGSIVFAFSSLIGMFTHVFWDAFTHNTGYFVTRLSFLTHSVRVLNHDLYVYKICQHGSTLIGFAIIGLFLHHIKGAEMPLKASELKTPESGTLFNSKLFYHTSAWLIGLMVLAASYLLSINQFGIGRGVVSLINGLFIGYLIASMGWHYSTQLNRK